MAQQHTIKNPIQINGIGLHSGKPVSMVLKPAPEDSGICFRRIDLNIDIKANPLYVHEAMMCTKLIDPDHPRYAISTIEHLMSALAGLEVDNLIVELSSEEVPIMDGSASPFVFLIESAGIIRQDKKRKIIKVLKPIRVEEGDKFAEFSPADSGLHFMISLDYSDGVISKTNLDIEFSMQPNAFTKNIARARTYGFVKDLEYLHQNNLALGASLDNAIGVDGQQGVVNAGGLRFRDEFVRHKLLDAIGDLYLAGPIQGHFRAYKPGHALNNKLIRALLDDKSAWEWV